MAKSAKGRRKTASTHHHHRTTPYPLPCRHKTTGDLTGKPKDWEDITCSVCKQFPHNAVLLLCSSHDNGCRPYMCNTSSRYSNCLHQYKSATSTKPAPPHQSPVPPTKGGEGAELTCPLCRGQVKGWTVVESVRDYLKLKKRSCTHDKCSFVGVYKKLKKHVREVHPSGKPREVGPEQERNWRRIEQEDEMSNLISLIFGSVNSDDEDAIHSVMTMIHLLYSGGPAAFVRAFGDDGDVLLLMGRLMRLNGQINRVILGMSGGFGRRRRLGGER